VFPLVVSAATYYVDGNSLGGACNDSNNGTALITPWCTIQKASTTAVAGDTVNIREANYRETVTASSSGTLASPIIFQNYLNEVPIINGADRPATWVSLGAAETAGMVNSGFEPGNFSEYNSTTVDGTNALTAATDVVNRGDYSMKAVYSGADKNAKAGKTVTATNDLYARIYFRIQPGFDLAATNSRFDILYIKRDSTFNLVRASIVKTGVNTFGIQGRIEAPTGAAYSAQTFYSGTGGEITTGTWHYLELRYKGQDGSTGGAEIWLDGVSKGSVYNLNTVGVNNTPGRVEIGGNSSAATTPTAGSTLYIDDLRINSSLNGAFIPMGEANVYQAAGVNWTVREVYEDAVRLGSVGSLAALTSAGKWYVDTAADILYVWSSDSTKPSTHVTEAARRNSGFDFNGYDYITLDGIKFRYHNNTSFGAIHLLNADNNSITNIIAEDNKGPGIMLNNSTYNTISDSQFLRNLRLFGGGTRFENGSNNNSLLNNIITGVGLTGGNGMSFCGDSVCNSVGNNNNLVSGNVISNVYDSCMYFDTNNDNNTVEKNTCHNVLRESSSAGGNGFHFSLGADNNVVRNNLLYNLQRHGISFRDGNVSQGYINNNNNEIYNNTIYNVGYGGGGFGVSGNGIDIQGTNSNNIVKNNIVVTASTAALNIDPGSISTTISDYNLLYNVNGSGKVGKFNGTTYTTLAAFQAVSGQDSHSISADPLFMNAAGGDFSLADNSPAINRGINILSFTTDLSGRTRPIGSNYDIGSYESLITTTTPLASDNIGQATPNSTQSNSGSTTQATTSRSCTAQKPGNAPSIFQINRYENSATLYINPGGKPYTSFMISYGINTETEQYSAKFDQSNPTGAVSYTINDLNSQTPYSFKVRAFNDCALGNWGNTIKVESYKGTPVMYYNSGLQRIINYVKTFVSNLSTTPVQPAAGSVTVPAIVTPPTAAATKTTQPTAVPTTKVTTTTAPVITTPPAQVKTQGEATVPQQKPGFFDWFWNLFK